LAGATGDEAGQQDAVERLEAYAAEFGAFIEAATDGELPGSTVEAELAVHVETLVAAVDSVLAGSPDV
jgi:hypothetical protein